MRVLVWQWGRRGAMPRIAAELAAGFAALPHTEALLSLSTNAELLRLDAAPVNDLPVATYRGMPGCLLRLAMLPVLCLRLRRDLRRLAPDLAICVEPGPLDPAMVLALRLCRVRFLLIVHERSAHAGDERFGRGVLSWVMRSFAVGIVTLSAHVAHQMAASMPVRPILCASLPRLKLGPPGPPPLVHGGRLRLLFFGRLRPYKGLGLLAEALQHFDAASRCEMRVVGQGGETAELAALRALPHVSVENRWVAEDEIAGLLAWADAVVLPYLDASQSGVAACALAAGRFVVATDVGGLREQLGGESLARICEPSPMALAATLESLIADPPSGDTVMRQDWRDLAALLSAQAMALDATIILRHAPKECQTETFAQERRFQSERATQRPGL